MKTKIFKQHLVLLLLLLISPFIIYNFYNPETTKQVNPPVPPLPYTNNNIYDKFLLGAMDEENGAHEQNYITTDSLMLNISHAYTETEDFTLNGITRKIPKGRVAYGNVNDRLFTDVDFYKEDVTRYLKEIFDNHNGRRSITQRPKIQWLCYGQSSKYQAEDVPLSEDQWFYSYNREITSIGHQVPDQGREVIYCRSSISTNQGNWVDNPGYVCKRLKANTEQCNPESNFDGDVNCDWYVKPMMRADMNFIRNPVNSEVPICKIHIIKQDLSYKIPEVVIKAKHFQKNYQTGNLYNGNYIQEFFFTQDQDPTSITFRGNLGDWYMFRARGDWSLVDTTTFNNADIKVEWLGNCDMWLDYVKVENDIANDLLSTNQNNTQHLLYDKWIKDEVEQIAFNGSGSSVPLLLKFYMELSEFNNIPCMAYVNSKLKEYSLAYSGGQYSVDLMADFTPAHNFFHVSDLENFPKIGSSKWIYDNYVYPIGLTQFFAESYPLTSVYGGMATWSEIPNTLPSINVGYVLANPVSTSEYDLWLQDELNGNPYLFETTNPVSNCPLNSCNVKPCEDKGNFRWVMKTGSEISRNHDIPFIFMPQGQLWYRPYEIRREPTNEELNMMANLAVSYGAKGLQWFWFRSEDGAANPCEPPYDPYARGMVDPNGDLLTSNAYHQTYPKWQVIKDISLRMKVWENEIMNFDNSLTHSYIYQDERSTFLSETYFNDIKTYVPDINNINSPSSIEEPVRSRYLQAAVFKKFEEPYSNYFMLVNRRCSPYFAPGEDPRFPDGENGGRRYIKVSFKESELQYFTNWKIVDLENNNVVTTFNKNGSPYIDLGWYLPGQGKLYRLAPVMVDGGTLAYDENLNLTPAYECYNTVYNGGKNISIYAGDDINFTHLGSIVMNGGSFQSGELNGSQSRVNLHSDGIGGPFISLENCAGVRMYNTDVQSNFTSSYMVSIANCTVTDIRNSVFTAPENGGSIGYFASFSKLPKFFNLNISDNNHFNMNSSQLPALSIMAFGGVQIPLLCSGNTFSSPNTNSSTAMNIVNVSGGIIQNNVMNGFYYGVNALSSNTGMYHNTITSSGNVSYGIHEASGTVIDMSQMGNYMLGLNTINNMGSTSNNLFVDNSYFQMNSGYNIFNISGNSESYHLYGTFLPASLNMDLDNKLNCFKVNQNPSDPVKSVNWSTGGEVQFNFIPYSCNNNQEGDGIAAADLGDGIIDSITYINGNPLNVYDSLGMEMRKRNYSSVIGMCARVLNAPPDTIQVIDAVSKLYMATISTDTTETGITSLKDFYLNVIMNNPSNSALVRNCNYFVQKCKVNLHQYSSAISGFQQIINENPYSYEALVAHWDYMAAYLLDSLSGGSEMGDGDDRNSKLTKEQKIYIKEVIRNIYENERTKEENNINKLVAEVNNGNEVSKIILEKKRTLKEVVQNQTPHNMFEHIKIVNSDIKKVFGKSNSENRTGINNIPMVFRISQNYPNPFNPTTKINYDLPRDSKVNIVIYDILGREVKRLVNNEIKQAGSYIVDFNASNYASGVYFYRIEAEEPNGNKFVDSKKMVLLK